MPFAIQEEVAKQLKTMQESGVLLHTKYFFTAGYFQIRVYTFRDTAKNSICDTSMVL